MEILAFPPPVGGLRKSPWPGSPLGKGSCASLCSRQEVRELVRVLRDRGNTEQLRLGLEALDEGRVL